MAYNSRLGSRRHEGWERDYHAATGSVAVTLSDQQRARHVGGVAPAKQPHREIEGAHLRRGRITLDLIELEYLRNLGEE